MPAIVGEAFEVARHIIAADHVEHDIDTAAVGIGSDGLDIILRRIIDREIGPERAQEVARRPLGGVEVDARKAVVLDEREGRRTLNVLRESHGMFVSARRRFLPRVPGR